MPENSNFRTNSADLKSSTFRQRREDILKRLVESCNLCHSQYNGRKELATEKDASVNGLCECLEEAFNYGLKQPSTNTSSLFQNVQEIVSGSIGISLSSGELFFWDFCRNHLTTHERDRFDSLKNVISKQGKGRAFIRASLNENSLQRYVKILVDADDLLQYYTLWSILVDSDAAKILTNVSKDLATILFAITVDSIELNENSLQISTSKKEEPVIYAPTPKPISIQNKKKVPAIIRPIEPSNTTSNLFNKNQVLLYSTDVAHHIANNQKPCDMLEHFNHDRQQSLENEEDAKDSSTIKFLKELNQSSTCRSDVHDINEDSSSIPDLYESCRTEDDKSETSSQYSKSSSALSQEKLSSQVSTPKEIELNEKLQEMTERCTLLETRVAQLSLENRQLIRRLTQSFKETGIDPSSSLTANFLITIPQVKVLKSNRGRGKYCTYDIHVTMRQNLEHWMITRRYREFRELHKNLKVKYPVVTTVEFPPKKHFGNMNPVFIDERRQQLQIYLISIAEIIPEIEACKTKQELVSVFSFFKQR